MRRKLEETFLRVVRLYTRHFPIKKGKYRLYQAALSLSTKPYHKAEVRLPDGRRFLLEITPYMQDRVFFMDEYEPFLSAVTSELISGGDICIDAGANFGWYTSLMALQSGPGGEVHAFEPVPPIFDELRTNHELWGSPPNVRLNLAALSDANGSEAIYLPETRTSGHSSFRPDKDTPTVRFDCETVTLDDYLTRNSIGPVDFVKVDVEGAEMDLLRGASRLFEQEVSPIFLMEMALEATRKFGYTPNDLVSAFSDLDDYEFWRADELNWRLNRIDGFEAEDVGGNVFCIPAGITTEKRERIARYCN